MQKIGLIALLVMMSVIAQSRADDQIHLNYDSKTQIRVATPVKIKQAIDAITLLSETGEIYSLTGLNIPDDNDTAPKTQKRLTELTAGKNCTIYQTRNEKVGRINRMNQILGHFTCGKDDIWIQGTLLNEGLARVRTTPENDQLATMMLILESAARGRKQGLWSLPVNAPLPHDKADTRINSFEIVEGKIFATAQNRDAIFLNFTSDWKSDFSIGIPAKLRRDFSKSRIDLMSLKGKTVRVRGWMRNYNGPYIELDHAEQLEIISTTPPSLAPTNNNEENTDGEKQFMHTIGGPTAPTVEKPTPPAIERPTTEKTDNGKAN